MSERDENITWYEFIHTATVKVLKWNNRLINIPRTIIIFRLHNNVVEVQKESITREEIFMLGLPFTGCCYPPANTDAFPFLYSSGDPVSFKHEFDSLISSTGIFLQDNCEQISGMVFANFHGCFNCNFTQVDISTKIVFVIEIYRTLVQVVLPHGVNAKYHTNIDRDHDELVRQKESVEEDLEIKLGEAFSEDDLQDILCTLCHCIKIDEGYLNSAKTHADTIHGLSQVMVAIRKLKFADEDHDVENQCAICWEQFCKEELIVRMPCSHIFHHKCAFMWLVNSHGSCPLCRSVCKTSIFS